MRVADLEGALLDYWVSRACGINAYRLPGNDGELALDVEYAEYGFITYNPSNSWRLAGPLIDKSRISLEWTGDGWRARRPSAEEAYFSKKSPLIAAMRCFVASRLGSAVPDTEEGPPDGRYGKNKPGIFVFPRAV